MLREQRTHTPAISFDHVCLSLGERPLFHDFSLHIKNREKVVLSAPSGFGKSTLLKMVMGFVYPQKGRILVQGTPLSHQTVCTVRHSCAYLSQDVDFRDQPVGEVLTETAAYFANHQADLSIPAMQTHFHRLFLRDDILDKRTVELSGGERQRLGIALCAALDRPIWLMDEPLSALDKDCALAVVDLLAQVPATVLVISHHPGLMDSGAFREVRF